MVKKIIITLLIITSLVFPMKIFAKIGVGVGTGKIEIDEKMKPGAVYSIPSISVVNTGDEVSEYEMVIQYHNDVPELRPSREWFVFKPQKFYLQPKESQMVEIKLELPTKAQPGKYFAYIEARPLEKGTSEGGAKIGIAAAAKLYFAVSPSNFVQGIFNKAASYWKYYAPWSYVIALVVVLAIIILLFRKFFAFKIGLQLKKKNSGQKDLNNTSLRGRQQAVDMDIVLLQKSLVKVERFYESLSSSDQERLAAEANQCQVGIAAFLYQGDGEVLCEISDQLREFLLLARDGLEIIKRENFRMYEHSIKMITEGLLGFHSE